MIQITARKFKAAIKRDPPSAPNILTAEDPVGAFESAIPLLVEILPDKCSSSELVRDILWSTYNHHPVGLKTLHRLDQDRKDAVLAIINLRMAFGVNANPMFEELLELSGELKRREETLALAKELNLPYFAYPLTYDQGCELVEAIDRRDSR